MGAATTTRVLIVGASGFIGSHLAEYVSQVPGQEVLTIDLDVLDLSAADAADALPEEVDYCYHLAATMPTWKFYKRPHEVLSNDLRVTLNLADWASGGHCKKIIYASSNEVYLQPDADEDTNIEVAPILQPRTSYQLSKITSEAILQNSAQQMGFEATSFRLTNVYGPGMHDDQVVRRFVEFAHRNDDPFTIGGFDVVRQFIHVDDIARSLWDMRDRPVPVINVPGDEIRMIDLAKLTCSVAGYQPQFVEERPPPGSPIVKRMRTKYALPIRQVPLEMGVRSLYESLYLAA